MFLLDKEHKSAKFHHLKEPCRLRERSEMIRPLPGTT